MNEQFEELREGYKSTELGVLPNDWDVVRLGDLVDVKGGKRLPKSHSFSSTPTPYPYIRVIDFFNWSVKTTELKYLTPEDREIIKKYIITTDDVYISIAGTIGLVGSIPPELNKANLTENAARLSIRNPKTLDKLFLIGFLASKRGQYEIRIRASKTSQPKLALNRIKEIPIPLPPLSEQQKIASILSTVQNAKEKTEAVINAAKDLKRSMMKHLFTYGPVPPQEAENVPLKETEIGMIPEEWEVVRLGDIADFSKRPKDLDVKTFERIPFISMEMIPIERIYIRVYLMKKPSEISSGVYCEKGDILLPKITPCFENGKQGIVEDIPSNFAFATTEVYPIKPKNDLLDKLFLFYFLIRPDIRRAVSEKMQGTTGRRRVPKDAVDNMLIPHPPISEQKKIASILSAIDQKIEAEESVKKTLEDLFKTLLHDLMTAKIRVNNLNINLEGLS